MQKHQFPTFVVNLNANSHFNFKIDKILCSWLKILCVEHKILSLVLKVLCIQHKTLSLGHKILCVELKIL